MTEILCSILIPVYNGEKFIQKTIESCLAQTLNTKIEIIVVDDCSKDTSFQIIQSLSSQHPNVIALQNEENSGINKSVNKAASLARGKYILFLGHDDILRPNHIETILNEFDEETSFVHCNADLIDKNDHIIGVGTNDAKQLKKNKRIKTHLLKRNMVHSTGAIINRVYFDQVGGWDEQFRHYGEWLLWIKLAHLGKVKYSTKIRAMYRKHETNITNTFSDIKVKNDLDDYFDYCRKTAFALFKPTLWTRLKFALRSARKSMFP